MKIYVIAVILTLFPASAQAGLTKGPQQIETVQSHTEASSVSKPAAKPAKKKRHREDDDDIDVNIKVDEIDINID